MKRRVQFASSIFHWEASSPLDPDILWNDPRDSFVANNAKKKKKIEGENTHLFWKNQQHLIFTDSEVLVLRCYEVSTSGHFFLKGANLYSKLLGFGFSSSKNHLTTSSGELEKKWPRPDSFHWSSWLWKNDGILTNGFIRFSHFTG